jgi:hypothetical protein
MDGMFKVGDKVFFGRKNGEQTWGTIVKINPKKLKVRQDASRGTMRDYPVGTIWTVPSTLVHLAPSEPGVATASTEPSPVKKVADAADPVIGATVAKVRLMTDAELQSQGWSVGEWERPVVIELSTGAKLFAMQDDEGNGPGALAGETRVGESFRLLPVG